MARWGFLFDCSLDEDLAPTEEHFSSDESEAKQAAAKAALARIRELQQAK